MPIAALRRLFVPFLAVAVTIGLLALSSGDSQAQWVPGTPQFDPIFDAKLCNDLKATFSGPSSLKGGGGTCAPNTAASSNADITFAFLVPTGHLAYDQAVWLSAGGANESRASGTTIPDGAPAGGLESRTTLGLAANPCNNTIYPDFIWWNAVTDPSVSVACDPEGTDDRWLNMVTDDTPDGAGPNDDFPGQADPDSPIVTGFPSCSAALFDPDGDGIDTDGNPATIQDQPVQPNWRGAGLTQVPPAGDWQMLQNFEFNPGDLQAAFSANAGTRDHAFAKLPASLGYINVVILNDPTTVVLQPNPISDFCTVLGTKGMIKGSIDTDGDGSEDTPRITQPAAAGSYLAEARTRSYRDADGDGIENNMDTCVWTANVRTNVDDDGDQRENGTAGAPGDYQCRDLNDNDGDTLIDLNDPNCVSGIRVDEDLVDNVDNDGDTRKDEDPTTEDPYKTSGPDTDMLDSACDPAPAQKNDDQDGDGYLNSQDYCPLVANPLPGGETDSENSVPYNSATGVLAAGKSDGGPPQDAIGDDCDSEKGGNDLKVDGIYFNTIYVDSVCIGGTDNDQDGWCAAQDNNDTDSYNPAAAEDGTAAGCANGVDDGEAPGGQPPDGLVDRWDPDCNPNVKDTGGTYSNLMPDATDPDEDDDSYDADNTEDGDDLEDQGAPGSNQCGDTVDNDADTKIDNVDPDCRNSVYQLANSNEEWCVGTDPLNDCPLIKGHDTWPPDFNTDGVSNILDIVQLTPPVFNSTPPNPNYVTRKDLNCDGTINILDIVQLTPPVFNKSCFD